MIHWVMDYETLSNCFTGVFEAHNSEEQKIFVIHESRNDLDILVDFFNSNIRDKSYHISFNGLEFDAQITHYILDNYFYFKTLPGSKVAEDIYEYAQSCIRKRSTKDWQDYSPWNMSIKQIDVFKLNHWDNPAKKSSLKWIQFSMDWYNLQDMPIHHTTRIREDQIENILSYNINDVKSTKEIFIRSYKGVQLRAKLSKEYDIDLYSASEPRISKEIFAYYMSEEINISKKDLKNLRTHHNSVALKDVILPYVKFKTPELNSLLNFFSNAVVYPENTKGALKFSVNYKGVTTEFGTGGTHGARKAGIYESDDDYVIISSDVVSYYPNLVIRNKWSPGHFPADVFCKLYEWFFIERKKIPKSNPMNYVYKIILNSTFGLSNDVNSFFYDIKLFMSITVNGQLLLMMLYESIMEQIPGSIAIMQNTDGIEIKIPRSYIEKYMELCKEWENLTKLQLEHDEYDKLILADVNNYIGIFKKKYISLSEYRDMMEKTPHYKYGKDDNGYYYQPVKMKGRFDFHDLALHKNKSKLVIRKAIHAYFVNDILPTDYLESNTNILDYCIGVKTNRGWKQIAKYPKNGKVETMELQKVNRYYVSNKGAKFFKVNDDGRRIQLEAGKWLQKLLNKYKEKDFKKYDVNYSYYLKAIDAEINNIIQIDRNQLNLF